MTYDVVHTRPEVDEDLLRRMRTLSSATVHEVMDRHGALCSTIKPIRQGMHICGRAFTVWAEPGDNLIVHKALSMAAKDDVLVVCNRMPEAGFWGEVMSVAAMSRGIVGLLTDGAVRDTQAIAKRGFPVFAANTCIKGTLKHMPGKINHAIIMGGQIIHPGDIVMGDDDGVVVIPLEWAQSVYEGSVIRETREAEIVQKLERGMTTLELLNLEAPYRALGLSEETP